MQITLDKSDILKEIYDNYQNDSDFLYEIVDKGTNNWEAFKDVAKSIIKELKRNNELNIDELLPE
jgi:hypothetical protein